MNRLSIDLFSVGSPRVIWGWFTGAEFNILASSDRISSGLTNKPLEFKGGLIQEYLDLSMFIFENSHIPSFEGISRSFGLDLVNDPVILKL